MKKIPRKINIIWDTSKPSGDKIRLMDIKKLKSLGLIMNTKLKMV